MNTAPMGTDTGVEPRQSSDHENLRSQLTELEAAVDTRAAVGKVGALRSTLQEHFRSEEGHRGFFETVLKRSPQQQGAVAMLKAEHTAIMAITSDLHELLAAQQQPPGPAEQQRIQQLVDMLRAHEEVEEELLQEALASDLGMGH
jgi:hemerythrin-like domain-containing protein